MQNDLIETSADVLKENIKAEVSLAQVMAVEVDETTDIANEAQLSIILHYLSGKLVKEAYLSFEWWGQWRQKSNY